MRPIDKKSKIIFSTKSQREKKIAYYLFVPTNAHIWEFFGTNK